MGNIEILEDACMKLPHTTRKMFGGHGLFASNGGMFAGIVTDDEIILKFSDEAARKEFEAIGGRAWVYRNKSTQMTMSEWIVIPERFYDEPRELAVWAARAYRLVPAKVVAKGAKSAKGAKRLQPMPVAKPAAKKAPAATRASKKAPPEKAGVKKSAKKR
ncbi:MAG TPA: TfoX/Sxy family protein [Candidatus Thermoplasmatota archaeon]|nr:TfoX/Sxy family protein [Candidatus Thermoplasmatota archaeon]